MPIALLIAVVGSLALHGLVLFGPDLEFFGRSDERVVLRAEIKLPPKPANNQPREEKRPSPKRGASSKAESLREQPAKAAHAGVLPALSEATVPDEELPEGLPPPPLAPILPAKGVVRFAIFKESLGVQIGRAEHRWEFKEDGSYILNGVTETSGLAALIKPVRIEVESRGVLEGGGLRPETFRSLKNGKETAENADFDWSSKVVRLEHNGSVQAIAPGSQDILSLNYHLAYMADLESGVTIGVVTGKKYERYALDSLGEEEIEVPAGRFRTLHLRAMTDNTTEIWVALDRGRLPVKIRFTDKKGDSYEQVATELGIP